MHTETESLPSVEVFCLLLLSLEDTTLKISRRRDMLSGAMKSGLSKYQPAQVCTKIIYIPPNIHAVLSLEYLP
jgi:hypothetical protein